MFDWSHLFTIALIQGITEFLPVSSSGHLVLIPSVTSFQDQGQLLDVAAHFGTLGAVVIYLWSDIWRMIKGTVTFGAADKAGFALAMMVVLASLPVIIIGLIIELIDPAFLRLAITVALANIIFAGLLYKADTDYPATKQIDDLSVKDAVAIGCAQIFALIPGTSRSGVTITMARMRGYTRLDSARFSMILSVPVILGATLLKARHFFEADAATSISDPAIVAVLSLIAALIAIRLMMGWLARADFKIFVYYRLALGALLIAALATGII